MTFFFYWFRSFTAREYNDILNANVQLNSQAPMSSLAKHLSARSRRSKLNEEYFGGVIGIGIEANKKRIPMLEHLHLPGHTSAKVVPKDLPYYYKMDIYRNYLADNIIPPPSRFKDQE